MNLTEADEMCVEKKYEPEYICWKEKDFMSDRAVIRMTPHQRLMYRSLCQAAMFCETRPYLPDDDTELYLLADADDLEQWQANRAAVLLKFYPEEVEGRHVLAHKRCLADWEKHVSYHEARKLAGTKGGLAKASSAKLSSSPPKQNVANKIKENQIKENGIGAKRATQLPGDFVPNDNNRDVAQEENVDLAKALTAFTEFHLSKGSVFKDWNLALNTWLRNDNRFANRFAKKPKPAAPTYTGSLAENLRLQREGHV